MGQAADAVRHHADGVIRTDATLHGRRHQAASGYWQTAKTLARWCLINSYLASAGNHGRTVLDAITRALTGNPWLPQHALA